MKPILEECFADNGAHSHWKLINAEDGKTLWEQSDESPPVEAAGVQEDLFNDKLITRTIKDLPANATWDEIFSIGTGIPIGTQNMFKVYFNPKESKKMFNFTSCLK